MIYKKLFSEIYLSFFPGTNNKMARLRFENLTKPQCLSLNHQILPCRSQYQIPWGCNESLHWISGLSALGVCCVPSPVFAAS